MTADPRQGVDLEDLDDPAIAAGAVLALTVSALLYFAEDPPARSSLHPEPAQP